MTATTAQHIDPIVYARSIERAHATRTMSLEALGASRTDTWERRSMDAPRGFKAWTRTLPILNRRHHHDIY